MHLHAIAVGVFGYSVTVCITLPLALSTIST